MYLNTSEFKGSHKFKKIESSRYTFQGEEKVNKYQENKERR